MQQEQAAKILSSILRTVSKCLICTSDTVELPFCYDACCCYHRSMFTVGMLKSLDRDETQKYFSCTRSKILEIEN